MEERFNEVIDKTLEAADTPDKTLPKSDLETLSKSLWTMVKGKVEKHVWKEKGVYPGDDQASLFAVCCLMMDYAKEVQGIVKALRELALNQAALAKQVELCVAHIKALEGEEDE
jgi:hypothetical protein